ncbi:MAG: Rieske 2Fe-2S domain-containing protein [Myxococcota bacterium]
MAYVPKEDRFKGFARGWFLVAFSDELKAGDVQNMRYFGQELVLFRTQEGVAHVLNAYCPHLGAHLGKGKVIGDALECPFHAWRFDGTGQCVDIPYCERIPPKAQTRAWRTDEVNGMIFVWHDPQGNTEPEYTIPVLEEYTSGKWLPWVTSKLMIRTHPKEIVENVVDKAHFSPVHNTEIEAFENEFIDHMAIQRAAGVAYPQGGGKDNFKINATYYGPAYQLSKMEGVLSSRLVNAHTPIDENSLDLRFAVSLKIMGNAEKTRTFAQMYCDNLRNGFHEDIDIWENKLYRDTPVLCAGDGPIIKLRTWYQQFFQPSSTDQPQDAP